MRVSGVVPGFTALNPYHNNTSVLLYKEESRQDDEYIASWNILSRTA